MEVTKRNGEKEPVYFDKISIRLKNLVDEGKLKLVDSIVVAQKVIQNLYDGITTQELDNLSASICASFASEEPNYGLLGGRICVSNLHKMTPNTFYKSVNILMQNLDKNGEPAPILNKEVYDIINANHELIETKIIHDRDYLIDLCLLVLSDSH